MSITWHDGGEELWRGAANAWECDHLGHLNTRFYLTKVEQALPPLLARLGADPAAMVVTAQHMRFHKEVRAGAALHAHGRALRWDTQGGEVLISLCHSGGEHAATIRLVVAHATGSWASRVAAAAHVIPAGARERGLSMSDLAATAVSADGADTLGMLRTGLAFVLADQCDGQGRWRLSAAMALVADAVPHLSDGNWRRLLEHAEAGPPRRIGNVLVESGFIHHRWPTLGDRVEVRSAAVGCTERVTRTAHWLLDPSTGRAWAAVNTVGLPIDLVSRRPLLLTPAAQKAYLATACVKR